MTIKTTNLLLYCRLIDARIRASDKDLPVQYLGLSFDNDKILRIYEEFVLGANFSSYLSENLPIEMGQLKHYSASILEALGTIHILRKHL